jgi:translation initiation factor aIF-2/yIF-2
MSELDKTVEIESENENENETVKADKKKKKKKKSSSESKQPVSKPINPMAKLAQQRMKLIEEQNARIKAEQEAEERKIKEEEDKRLAEAKAIEDEKEKKRKVKQDKVQAQKDSGTYKTKSEKEKIKKTQERLENMKKSGFVFSDAGIVMNTCISNISENISNNKLENEELIDYGFRSPILCIMGHVDTGKTKLLDKIRDTNVQEGEAGGITQQIGATFIPPQTLLDKAKINKKELQIPGILMIDTPGHEAFANLRSRGSSLCDTAIIVIDIVHGLEQQTIQSINMLVESNIKFIFALNKVDRLYGWNSIENRSIQLSLEENQVSIDEFKNRLYDITTQIMTIGLNAKLFWENNSIDDTISICPISAKTGEGVCDLISEVIKLNQTCLSEQIKYKEELKCIVMEKTITEGIGSSVDVILINGTLKKGDQISFQTSDGICKTTIRNLLTPPPNRESRIKSEYIHHDEVKGSMGLKIVANDIDKVIVGSQIYFSIDESVVLEQPKMQEFTLEENGVSVFASTQGALEALVHFLQKECKPPVPINEVNLGTVMKKHITKMTISNKSDKKEFSTILAFNVNIDEDVEEFSKKNSIQIFSAEIIYHLFDQYIKYRDEMIKERKTLYRPQVVFPCSLKILEKHIYNKKSPLIFGVTVLEGNLHIGTPLIIPETKLVLGNVIGIQHDGKEVELGKKGTDVCIKIENKDGVMYGRHFDHKNNLCSAITRKSIDIIKNHFRDESTIDDAKLLMKLKGLLDIK